MNTDKDKASQVVEVTAQCAQDSYAGTASFGEIVGRLAAVGIEAYYADYRGRTTTYYLPDGSTHGLPLRAPASDIPSAFDTAAVQAAIRGAQRGEVKYPAFMQRTMAAGCIGYMVWIAGRHVTYFGRKGEQHVERFPS